MGEASPKPEVLLIAFDEGASVSLFQALSPVARPRRITIDDLHHPAGLLDAPAAVVALPEAKSGLEDLEPLRGIPAGRSVVLLVGEPTERQLESAVRAIEPARILPVGAPPVLLRHTVAELLSRSVPGTGARLGQRRAKALLGVSAALRNVTEQVRRVAPTRVPVLILGETGTGKELVARAVHEESPRARGPFVPVNCGAVPETLLEAELFGFRRGAFTGADRTKIGLFEVADGGTLFLDEVGDTSPALQAKLLRAIEQQEIRPVGGTGTVAVDVRIVSATHRNLQVEVREGRFREDLFYRLNTVALEIPPLRRRRVDIPFLAQHFAEEFGESHARRITLGEDFLEALASRPFPGNVRELRNTVERAIALSRPDEPIDATLLAPVEGAAFGSAPESGTLRERIEVVERLAITRALRSHGGNRARTAESLGLSRLGLRKKMRRLGLEADPRDPEATG